MPVFFVLFCLLFFSPSGGYLNLQCCLSSALTGSSAVGCCVTWHWTFNKTWIGATPFILLKLRQKYYWALAAGRETEDAVRKVKAELGSVKMWQETTFQWTTSMQLLGPIPADILYVILSEFKKVYLLCAPHTLVVRECCSRRDFLKYQQYNSFFKGNMLWTQSQEKIPLFTLTNSLFLRFLVYLDL